MPVYTESLRGAAAPRIEARLNTVLWVVFAATCVFYAGLAFDYFIAFGQGREGWWLGLFATLVGTEQALGAGSVHVDQAGPYAAGFNFMLMHTTTGALAMAIGPFQFVAAARRRFPRLHRNAGKVYLVSVLLSMIGGLAYLGATPLADIYSGAPFGIALAGLDIMVLLTAWLAYAAIRQRDIERHRAWMAYNFGLLLATPGLRLLWIAFGRLVPDMDQAASNLAIMTFLLPLCVSGMLLWFAAQPGRGGLTVRPTAMAATGLRVPWLAVGRILAISATLLVAMHHVLRFVLPSDPWTGFLPAEQAAVDAATFARCWPLAIVYVVANAVAMLHGVRAFGTALRGERVAPTFFIAAAIAALSGGALASWTGPGLLGGTTVLYYWWGLAMLWLLAIARAQSRKAAVARDWTLYAIALAFLPATVLPGIPLWQTLDALDFEQAVITAVTMSFAAHYLLVHLYLYATAAPGRNPREATARTRVHDPLAQSRSA